MNKVTEVLEDRGKEYGKAWYIAGMMVQNIPEIYYTPLFHRSPFAHNWFLMLSKLVRMLASPYKKDNYIDLIGYATLCLEYINDEE